MLERGVNRNGKVRPNYRPPMAEELRIKVKNSSRVFCWVRKQPRIVEVTVVAPGFCTPRIVMHMWLRASE